MFRLSLALTVLSAPLWAEGHELTIVEEFAQTCSTYTDNPGALIAEDLLSGNASGSAMSDDLAIVNVQSSGSTDDRHVFLAMNRFEGGSVALCRVSLYNFDGTKIIDQDEIIGAVSALVPDFLGTEDVVQAGGPAAGGNGGAYLIRWSTPEFPPRDQIHLTLSSEIVLIALSRTRTEQ